MDMAMDLTKLVTLGKLDRTVKIGDVTFKLVTPPFIYNDPTQMPPPIDVLVLSIAEIDGEVIDVAKRTQLKEMLAQMQGTVVTKLLDLCTDLITKQIKLVDEISSKKE
jgi:hypothetical protein